MRNCFCRRTSASFVHYRCAKKIAVLIPRSYCVSRIYRNKEEVACFVTTEVIVTNTVFYLSFRAV